MDFFSALSPAQASKPSVFELLAAGKLQEALSPALRYVLASYAIRYPRYLLRVLQYHDELFVFLMLVVQRHYLRVNKGAFAESFYGLKRARTTKHNRSADLAPRDVRWSMAALVVLPYVKGKLDEAFREIKVESGAGLFDEEDSDSESDDGLDGSAPVSATERRKLVARKWFLKLYPWINAAYGSAHVVYQILYMFDLTRYYTPVLHLLGVEVTRLTPADMRAIQRESQRPRNSAVAQTAHVALEVLKVALPTAVFFTKFVDWFFTTDLAKRADRDAAPPLPRAPPRLAPHPDGVALPPSRRTCPLCRRAVVNPTATPTGYVFCYACVHRAVEERGECPVTKRAVRVDELRRMFMAK
ncbi:ubiquitin-protein ligase peroxin 12 [Blastocladiella emersonii ATCC 22665]|nr:ubiquitin-protein ligase peroxin 12 [Blastocladiella emersonii ATCC 22665]